MTTAVTMVWRVTFEKNSLVDGESYYLDFASTLDKKLAYDIASELRKLKYTNVVVSLRVTFPP